LIIPCNANSGISFPLLSGPLPQDPYSMVLTYAHTTQQNAPPERHHALLLFHAISINAGDNDPLDLLAIILPAFAILL